MTKTKILCIAAIIIGLGAAWIFSPLSLNSKYAVPNPNAYDTLITAGLQVQNFPMDYDTTGDPIVIGDFLEENQSSVALIDKAANQDFLVIFKNQSLDEILELLGPLKRAMQLQVCRARLAEINRDVDVEMMAYTKLWKLANRLSRGGLLLHSQFATMYESLAIEKIQGALLDGRLSKDLATKLRKELTKLPRHELDRDELLAAEKRIVRQQNGVVASALQRITGSNDQLEKFVEDEYQNALKTKKAYNKLILELDEL